MPAQPLLVLEGMCVWANYIMVTHTGYLVLCPDVMVIICSIALTAIKVHALTNSVYPPVAQHHNT